MSFNFSFLNNFLDSLPQSPGQQSSSDPAPSETTGQSVSPLTIGGTAYPCSVDMENSFVVNADDEVDTRLSLATHQDVLRLLSDDRQQECEAEPIAVRQSNQVRRENDDSSASFVTEVVIPPPSSCPPADELEEAPVYDIDTRRMDEPIVLNGVTYPCSVQVLDGITLGGEGEIKAALDYTHEGLLENFASRQMLECATQPIALKLKQDIKRGTAADEAGIIETERHLILHPPQRECPQVACENDCSQCPRPTPTECPEVQPTEGPEQTCENDCSQCPSPAPLSDCPAVEPSPAAAEADDLPTIMAIVFGVLFALALFLCWCYSRNSSSTDKLDSQP
jgi:hypothetical protein